MQNDSSSLLKTTLQNAATTASVIPGVSTPSCFRVTCMDWARRVTVLLYTVLMVTGCAKRCCSRGGRKGFLLAALFAGGRSRRVHDLKPCPRSPSRAWFNGRSIDSHQVISGNGKALVSKAFAKLGVLRLLQSAENRKRPAQTTRPSNCSRLFAKNGPTPYHSKTTRSKMPGCPYLAIDIHLSVLSTRSSRSHQQELRWPVC